MAKASGEFPENLCPENLLQRPQQLPNFRIVHIVKYKLHSSHVSAAFRSIQNELKIFHLANSLCAYASLDIYERVCVCVCVFVRAYFIRRIWILEWPHSGFDARKIRVISYVFKGKI